MKQVSYSEEIVSELAKDPNGAEIQEKLTAMLSHADGIRGFFVTYLTLESSALEDDDDEIPPSLFSAMMKANAEDLVPLACMNVVMPTAMITMHQDMELSAQSRITAERGYRVLRALYRNQEYPARDAVRENCQAILTVATLDGSDATTTTTDTQSTNNDAELITYWSDFMDKWGYKGIQKRDIAQAMKSTLEN